MVNNELIPLDEPKTDELIPLDNEELIPLDEKPSVVQRIKQGVGETWSAFKNGVQFVGKEMEKSKDSTGYRTSPQGLLEEGFNAVHKATDIGGEVAAESLAKKGVNPYVAASAGMALGSSPDLLLAGAEPTGTLESAVEGTVKDVGGLTSAGEKVAQSVAKSESVAPASENVIRTATGDVRILDTAKVPQPVLDKLEHSKQVATKLESKVAKSAEELDNFTKSGPTGLSISLREQEWLNRIDQLKTEHADAASQIKAGLFESNLEPRTQAYLKKLEELKTKKDQIVMDHETLPMVGPKEQAFLDKVQAKRAELQKQYSDLMAPQPGSMMAGNQPGEALSKGVKPPKATNLEVKMNQLDQIEAKAKQGFERKFQEKKASMAQSVNKLETNINDLGREFGSQREKSLINLQDKAKATEDQISQIQAKYQMNRMEKFNRQKGKLTEIAAYAENDLRNLGFTSKDIENGFIKFVKGDPAGSKVVSAAERGNVISKDLYDGLVVSPDISGFNADFGQFTTNFGELDRMTNGAFSREVKQDLYNKSIQSYEINNHFLEKINSLMEKHGLTNDDGHTFTRYVEGEIQAPPGREKAFAAAKEEMGKVTDEALDLRNARRVQRGEETIPRRDNYITSAMEQSMKDDLYIPAKEALKSQFIKKKSAEFGFDKPRQDLIPEDMRMGAFDVIKMYTTKTAREVSLSDSVEKLRALAEVAQKSKKPNMANYFNSIADRMTGEAFTNAVKNMGISAEKSKILHKAMEVGGNYAANVVNQIGAGLNQINSVMLASREIGVGRAILSVPDGFLTELKEQILKATVNPAYESFATENSKVLRLIQAKETMQALKVAEKYGPLASVNQWIFKFFNDSLYKGVFNQAYKASKTTVMNGETIQHSLAIKVADAVVEKSQGVFEDSLKPAAISSHHPLLNLAAPLQTAVFNTFNVLKNDYFFAKLTPIEKAAAVGRFVATGAITNTMIALATGKQPSAPDAIPFFRLAQLGIGGIFSPLVKLAKGDFKGAGEQALLLTPQMRAMGGLQTIKTVKGAAQMLRGDTVDPRVLIFGPKPKEKSE